ncbi:MAG TPA: sterol desaturase family protein [Candidatus Udaeobacter sp.]|jgi:sterol desaturase/sphingolipid hydroxylase (fatty acid hydroxylase superfamily)|nr:sterol desaturase family protein [Candidatus Udaeobacter sp.]
MIPEFLRQFEITTSLIIIAVFLTLLMIETRFSLRQGKRSKIKRFLINVGVSVLALATGAYVVAPVALGLASWTSESQFGLLRVMPLPFTAEFILGFLLMDLTFYYWHRANHSIPLFWRFHNVHHVDPDLDVSTSFRFHFGEVLYSVGFRALQVYLIGISLFTYLVYELVFQCATIFHHSNVQLPIAVERCLNKVIVTPRMHGIHHSIVKDETNSNYSVIFRWWDLIHGTLRLNVRQSDVVIGVPAYLDPKDNKFLNLLILPFRKQREYWRLPDGKQPARSLLSGDENILLP